MNNALVLDALLILFILLFALIGFWRGVVKEGLAAGGILFGALVANNWSARLGEIGSNVLNITADASRFFTIEALLLTFTLVIGYGSGSLLAAPVRGLGARFGGAALGAVNAALLLAFSLQAVDQFIQRSSTQRLLADSHVAHALVLRFNWFLLIVTGIVVVLLFGRLVAERESRPPSPARYAGGGERRSARLPAPAEPSKLEPVERGFDPIEGRFREDAPTLRNLAPMPPVSAADISHDRAFPANGAAAPTGGRGDWRIINFSQELIDPVETVSERRCGACGEKLTRDDEFCPLCGQPAARSEKSHDADA